MCAVIHWCCISYVWIVDSCHFRYHIPKFFGELDGAGVQEQRSCFGSFNYCEMIINHPIVMSIYSAGVHRLL